MPTPFAWLRRKPGCTPFTCSNELIITDGDSLCGANHPPAYKNNPAMPAMMMTIRMKRRAKSAPRNSAGTGDGDAGLDSVGSIHSHWSNNLYFHHSEISLSHA